MENNLMLSVIVNPGTVTNNFDQFKELLKNELDTKFSTIEVSEERLKEAKDARAKLNKAKASLKEAMRSAQLQNDEPLVVPKQQAKEIEQLLDGYIVNLDRQIKEIEEEQRKQRRNAAKDIFAEILSTYPEEVQETATQCNWIENEKWSNATYSQLQIKKDCRKICDDIQTALQTFEGEFRPQMLADYIKNGNFAASLLFGSQLKKQKEAYEAAKKAREEVSPTEAKEPTLGKENSSEPTSCVSQADMPQVTECEGAAHRSVLFTEVISPSEFLQEPNAHKTAYIDLRITAPRYHIRWLLRVLDDMGIAYQRLNTKEQ